MQRFRIEAPDFDRLLGLPVRVVEQAHDERAISRQRLFDCGVKEVHPAHDARPLDSPIDRIRFVVDAVAPLRDNLGGDGRLLGACRRHRLDCGRDERHGRRAADEPAGQQLVG